MKRPLLYLLVAVLGLATNALAQYKTAREAESHSIGTPEWKNDPLFKKDVFTFARVKYSVNGKHGYGHSNPMMRWAIDFPDSDLNFSFRLQQMTSLKVDPDAKVIELTDKKLYDYPFIYIVEPGRLTFTDQEVKILREYLLNGGFLMFDDFWGDREYAAIHEEMKLVFPDREPTELPLEHPIFHCVFDLKKKPQVPGVEWTARAQATGKTWEKDGKEYETPHYRGLFDDKGRLMVLFCHNTDLGDGWEREGESEYYFKEFAEKQAYPMGVNIVFYVMSH